MELTRFSVLLAGLLYPQKIALVLAVLQPDSTQGHTEAGRFKSIKSYSIEPATSWFAAQFLA
jgi:hypothetical protein